MSWARIASGINGIDGWLAGLTRAEWREAREEEEEEEEEEERNKAIYPATKPIHA